MHRTHTLSQHLSIMEGVAERWRELSGNSNWSNLLEPLDLDLRQYIIHYGEMAQAAYDAFNSQKQSKYAGSCRYAKKDLFERVGLTKANPNQYVPTKYFYATSSDLVPESFILKPLSREAWSRESNWMGYIAVATEEGKVGLERRDILVVWRGTIQPLEWVDDFEFPMVSVSEILGKDGKEKFHKGVLSVYASDDPRSPYNKLSARSQVLSEVRRLVELYKGEEVSITITGHSLGGALSVLNAVDIIANGVNIPKDQPQKPISVTAFLFASPLVVNSYFRDTIASMKNLHVLRINNAPDIVHLSPLIPGYCGFGEELVIDTRKSEYLKPMGDFSTWHNLEAYLHGVAGAHGVNGKFELVAKRDIALVNKEIDALKDEHLIPPSWRCLWNKGMVQKDDGSWLLEDREKDSDD